MQLSYRLDRGFHHWECIVCGERGKELIPDQADDRYRNNPGNPLLAVCTNCNHGKAYGSNLSQSQRQVFENRSWTASIGVMRLR